MTKTIEHLFLGIDVGTESVRCGLFNREGTCLQISVFGYETIIPYLGWAEQDPVSVWIAFQNAVRSCISQSGVDVATIKSIAVTTTSVTVVCVDEFFNPIGNAILWMDTRAWREAETINDTRHPALHYVGGKVSPEWMLPKLIWIRHHMPQVYQKSSYIVEIMDWINFNLTGRWTLSMCNTSCEWNYVRPLGGWPQDLLDQVGIGDVTEKWPRDMLYMGEPIGTLSQQASELLGLDRQTLVVESGMDTYVASLGVNVLRPGTMAMVLGNSSCYLVLSEKEQNIPGTFGPIPDAILAELWAYQGGQTSAGSIIRWFAETVVGGNGRRARSESVYKELDQLASAVPAGAEGLILLDTWQGERTPNTFPAARGAFIGLSLKHTEAHLFRAFLESVAFGARHIMETFEKSGITMTTLNACGGGIRSKLWMQIYADILGKPLLLGSTPHCSALGSAICAAVGFGAYSSLKEAANNMTSIREMVYPQEDSNETYEFHYQQYLLLKQSLRPYFSRLNSQAPIPQTPT